MSAHFYTFLSQLIKQRKRIIKRRKRITKQRKRITTRRKYAGWWRLTATGPHLGSSPTGSDV
eukprot:10813986-Heterocapsa_arctica.AAC.1